MTVRARAVVGVVVSLESRIMRQHLSAITIVAALWPVAAGCVTGTIGDAPAEQSQEIGEASSPTRFSGLTSPVEACDPAPEVCDGFDNDCDGDVDEECPCVNGEVQSCYSGDPITEGVGICTAGMQSCANWQWGPCQGTVGPAEEICDGKDNNCDGNVDEGNAGGGNGCLTGQPGVCSAGMFVCDGGSLVCTALEQPAAEICDGQDNNCDGQVDEGNPGGGGACDTGLQGVCAEGLLACQGGTVACVQGVFAGQEACGDGQDNDCDGQVDENCSNCAHGLCSTGIALTAGCDACVTSVCNADAYCCSTSWDSLCVSEASSICGLIC